MHRVRKYFRGSGRALAFIFIASIIWLIFDMAALRFSFNDVNSRLRDELFKREQGGSWKPLGRANVGNKWSDGGQPWGEDSTKLKGIFHPPGDELGKGDPKAAIRQRRRTIKPMAVIKTNAPIGVPVTQLLNLERGGQGENNKLHEANVSQGLEAKAYLSKISAKETLIKKQNAEDSEHNVEKPVESEQVKDNIRVSNAENSRILEASKDVKGGEKKVKSAEDFKQVEESLDSKHVVKVKDVEGAKDAKALEDAKAAKDVQASKEAAEVIDRADNTKISKIVEKDKGEDVKDNNVLDSKIVNVKEAEGSKDNLKGPPSATLKLDNLKEQSLEKLSKETVILIQKSNLTNDGPDALPDNAASVVIVKKDEKNKLNISDGAMLQGAHDSGVKNSGPGLKEGILVESENADVKGTLRNSTYKLANVNISSSSNADVESKQLIHDEKENRVPGTGMHKVRTLDATLKPRDANAPGQFGRSWAVPKDKEKEASKRWKEGNFNVYLSDLIPVDRAIEDTRPKGCSDQLVHDDLPNTSVIVCFVDEVWSTLLRTVFSVLNRSPPELIKEIILVDDFSTKAYLKENLDNYMKQYPKVRILHLKERNGLIRARIAGANIATGDVLTFLDSHVECNVGWLEPLLEQVRINRKKVACPVIEVISDKDMSYMTVDNFQRGVFSWPMNFGWKPIPTEVLQMNNITDKDPIRCPVMAGGLFSIDKKYFYELGTYDPGLDVWGGENMEISFKIWMCGGEIEIIPCSRVGHIFRNDNPYSFPKDRVKTVERNLVRVAEVWLDEYKELFYGHGQHLLQEISNIGVLTEQKELRKKLQCKSFRWYLDNVFPDLEAPVVRASGVVANIGVGKCLSLQNSTLTLDTCDASKKNQHFNFTWLKLIKQGDLCITPGKQDNVVVQQCDNLNNRFRWLHKSLITFQPSLASHLVLESIPRPTCLEIDVSNVRLKTNACNLSNKRQKWQFEKYFAA